MSNASNSFNLSAFDRKKEECLYLIGIVWQKNYLTQNTYILLVAVTVISLIAVLPTILLNWLVILAVATRRRLQSNSNILLACLASTDLLTGLVVQPIHIAVEVKRILGVGPFCTIEKVFAIFLALATFASLTHLVLISTDRYIAIKHSLRYQSLVTRQRILIGVLLAWAFIMLLTILEIVLSFINSKTTIIFAVMKVRDGASIIILLFFVVFMIYTNLYIFSETRRQKQRIQTEQVPQEEVKRRKKDNKAANTVVFILAALIISYCPACFATAFIMVRYSEHPAGDSELNAVNIAVSWSTWSLVLLGSLVNPIIYCWRSKKLRRVFLEILHLKKA